MECNRKVPPYMVVPSQAAKEDAVQIVVFVRGPLLQAIAPYETSSLSNSLARKLYGWPFCTRGSQISLRLPRVLQSGPPKKTTSCIVSFGHLRRPTQKGGKNFEIASKVATCDK